MSIHSTNLFNDTGIQVPKGACVVIVRTEWNSSIIEPLIAGCSKVLDEYAVTYKIISVPGAFEIPFGIKKYWELNKYKDVKPTAFIAIGCVLRGDTPHFDYVCKAVTDGIVQLNLQLPIPTIFGVLTVDNEEQALARTGGVHGNKGEEAAITALKMICLDQSF
jgi:6,7-dimethyl-8-ribityllumazine synthase